MLAVTSVAPQLATAQQALVLSGGASRGLAHVGVLLRLEELGYDPDLVVGTSMGAVIGALYAAGYNADEIRTRTVAVQWGGLFDPTPVLLGSTRTLRLPMLTFSLDVAQRQVSRGLFGEWRVNRALVHLLFDANARARGDFDRLARRYRAVAADLQTGEKVVLAAGDLTRAVRASMAYPGFFAPVRWGERLLIDGGVVDNLPTSVARQLGATSVIAVDVSRPPEDLSLREPLAIAQRAIDLMQQNLHPDTIPPDILIAPDMEAAPSGPLFPDDPTPLIELGAQAARQMLPPAPARADTSRPSLPPAPTSFVSVRIEAPDSALATLAQEVFAPVALRRYDPNPVLTAVDRLYSTDLFAGIWPRVTGDTLVVQLDAAPRLSLSLGAGFENDRGGRGWMAVERYVALGRRPAVLSAAASTDGLTRWGALSARVHMIGRPGIAWSIGTHVQEHSARTFIEDARITTEVLRAGGWLGLEFPHVLRERLLTVTGRGEWIDPENAAAGNSFGVSLRLTSVPSEAPVVGVPLLLEGESRWGERSYRRIILAGSLERLRPSFQFAALADLRAVSSDAPLDVVPALGDQHAIPGLRWGEERNQARAVAGFDVAVPVPLGGFARLMVRTGAVANEPENWRHVRWITGAQLGGVWRTPLGLFEAGYGRATIGDGRFDISIGRNF